MGKSPMDRVVSQWSDSLPQPLEQQAREALKRKLKSYTIYGTMLLLPAGTMECLEQNHVMRHNHDDLFDRVAEVLQVTHIAVNNPIPPEKADRDSQNVIRSPINFQPVHGDFGPSQCRWPPSQEEFGEAYWTTAKQNGIWQTWAPRWTMFSRGNISEKARLLELDSVRTAVQQGELDGRGCAAVDLYAGIGYFTFSYLKAGVSKVLCWDLNPWSIEGLTRGAKSNKWKAVTYQADVDLEDMVKQDSRLLVFEESNERATERLKAMRPYLSPIRHVNCGLLPTSKGSWETAFLVIDPELGGWVHVHENFEQSSIKRLAESVRQQFQHMLENATTSGLCGNVALEGIHEVKTYAPGVWHVVLDIYVPPHPAPS